MSNNSNEIRYFEDGEQATASVLNRPIQDLEKQAQYMSKVEFYSHVNERREKYAGSGIISSKIPKYEDAGTRLTNISGSSLSVRNHEHAYSNVFGIDSSENSTSEKKALRFINVNGIKINYTNGSSDYQISTPAACTSLGLISGSTVPFDMKQGDFAILDNKDTITGDIHISGSWEKISNTEVKSETASGSHVYFQDLIPEVEYEITFNVESGQAGFYTYCGGWKGFGDTVLGENKLKFKVHRGCGYMSMSLGNPRANTVIKNISIKQVKSQVVVALVDTAKDSNTSTLEGRDPVSRQDLVFLETWHEDITEKDIVYPYGNVQYRGGNTDGLSGITEGTFNGADTYSLFGVWQEAGALVGKGYIWSSLSNEDKFKVAMNPINNIYKDGSKIIQVRYRIRVVKGLGNDWDTKDISSHNLSYDASYGASRVAVKGKESIIELDNKGDYCGWDSGSFSKKTDISFFTSYGPQEDMNIAIPIALVQRRNDGAYDPVHNPEGSGTFSDDKMWYETTDSHNSLVDCFNNKKNGSIGTPSGRPDGLFSNEISEKDIEDLRMSAHKVTDRKALLSDSLKYSLSNKLRGKETNYRFELLKEVKTTSVFSYNVGNNMCLNFSIETQKFSMIEVGRAPVLMLVGDNGSVYSIKRQNNITGHVYIPYTNSHTSYLYGFGSQEIAKKLNILFPIGTTLKLYITKDTSYTQNNTMTQCDIIGDPRKLKDRVKYTVVNGTSQTINLLKGDYVKNDDNKVYRSLIARENIDLDTDDYTIASNWIDLGSDLDKGGYPSTWLEKGINASPLIVDDFGNRILPIDTEIIGGKIKIRLSKKNSKNVLVTISKKDGTVIKGVYHGSNDDGTGNGYDGGAWVATNENWIYVTTGYESLGYSSEQEMLDLVIVQIYYNTKANNMVNSRNDYVLESADNVTISGDVTDTNNSQDFMGNFLLNKVIISQSDNTFGLKLKNLGLTNGKIGNAYGHIEHESAVERMGSIKLSPTVKRFVYLSSKNGKATMNIVFKEMKWSDKGTSYIYYDSGIINDLIDGSSKEYDINVSKDNGIKKFLEFFISGMDVINNLGVETKQASDGNWYSLPITESNLVYNNGTKQRIRIPFSEGQLLSLKITSLGKDQDDGDGFNIEQIRVIKADNGTVIGYNDGDIGDDDKIQITHNVATRLDDNGEEVLYGQKSIKLPYFV